MEVEIIRSRKRKKTVSARVVDGRIEVRVPAGMSKAAEAQAVQSVTSRLRARTAHSDEALHKRATWLNQQYLGGKATVGSIRWVNNQRHRWASCTPGSNEIRVSSRLQSVPQYVLDAVIVHELAHTIEANHSKAFWALADSVPHAERAKGFLEALQYVSER